MLINSPQAANSGPRDRIFLISGKRFMTGAILEVEGWGDKMSLREVFVDELRDLYSAENQLVKALPKMAKAASAK